MKHLKISFLSAAAVLFAIGLSAFTAPAKKMQKPFNAYWFERIATSATNQDAYQIYGDGSTAPGCDALENVVCAVRLPFSTASGHTDKPDQSMLNDLYSNTDEFTQPNADIVYKP